MADGWATAGHDAIDSPLGTERTAHASTDGGTGETGSWPHFFLSLLLIS